MLVWPVACMVCVPGKAVDGTFIVAENAPVVFVVAEPTRAVSKLMLTFSLVPKPVPLTFVTEVGGPAFKLSVILAPAARVVELTEKSIVRQRLRTATNVSAMLTLRLDEKRIQYPHFRKHYCAVE